jgi:phage repressor protein C with HTH and peptisase S24 domain
MSRARENAKTNPNAAMADRTAFVARLHVILRHWPSADRLAKATGVSPSAFRKWLKGEAEPSRERLVALAEAAAVTVGWLAMGEGPEPRLQSVGKPPRGRGAANQSDLSLGHQEFVLLPKRPEAAAAGPESAVPPLAAEFIALRHDWIRSTLGIEPDHLLVETAVGESMLPGIRDGDLLLVDIAENKFRSFGVYVLEIAGERLVKRVQPKLDGSLTLISDNAAYESEHVSPAQAGTVEVVGRVLWTCGPVRGSGLTSP